MSDKNIPDWVIEQKREQDFLRSQLTVTLDDYKKAVEQLVLVSRQDTAGSAVAAQVLLSTYNGRNFQLDITDLSSLDYKNVGAAFVVMRGWLFTHEYPHNVIDNGREVFAQLEKKWQQLHVTKRYSNFYK